MSYIKTRRHIQMTIYLKLTDKSRTRHVEEVYKIYLPRFYFRFILNSLFSKYIIYHFLYTRRYHQICRVSYCAREYSFPPALNQNSEHVNFDADLCGTIRNHSNPFGFIFENMSFGNSYALTAKRDL